MRQYRKWNKYLLENHPLCWHSKFFQMSFFALLFWGISWLSAYLMTSQEVLNQTLIRNYYERSNFYLIHIIAVIIASVVWALYFYRNNPLKSFYPIRKGYFTKLFLMFFVQFALWVGANYPFTMGARYKANQLLHATELEQARGELNLAAPFMPEGEGNYQLMERIYPDPFPISYSVYDEYSEVWTDLPDYDERAYKSDYLYYETDRDYSMKQALDTNFQVRIDGRKYLFYTTLEKYEGSDSCTSHSFFNHFVSMDPKRIRLHEYDVLNYGQVMLAPSFAYDESYSNVKYFQTHYAKQIHDWVLQKQYDSIRRVLERSQVFLKKYGIAHDWDNDVLLDYWKRKDFSDPGSLFTSYRTQESSANLKRLSKLWMQESDSTFFREMTEQTPFFLDRGALQTLYENYDYLEESVWKRWEPTLFIGLGMAWLALLVEISGLIALLLTIPVSGVLIITISLLTVVLSQGFSDSGKVLLTISLTLFGIIGGVAIWLKRKNNVPRIIWEISMNLVYVMTPFVLSMAWLLTDLYTKDDLFDACDYQVRHLIPELTPAWVLLLATCSIILYLPMIKMRQAKPE
ncbi:MAG: hypothetical protein EP338_01675 [Bacteroidetes bacterium]|nr:MAG: hypothetical protein EP338_01675 [Bacteroidota bacterium]